MKGVQTMFGKTGHFGRSTLSHDCPYDINAPQGISVYTNEIRKNLKVPRGVNGDREIADRYYEICNDKVFRRLMVELNISIQSIGLVAKESEQREAVLKLYDKWYNGDSADNFIKFLVAAESLGDMFIDIFN